MPDAILYEDAVDLSGWFVMLGRAVPATWCDDVVAEINEQRMEGFF